MDRHAQFRAREAQIFDMAEQLLLDSGEGGMTLDTLALHLDLAKGTLYKHFQSKDELYLHLIIRHEQALLDLLLESTAEFQELLITYMRHHLDQPQRTALLHQLEERLAAGGVGLGSLFSDLYRIRKQRLRRIVPLTGSYLESINSRLTTRDYLAAVWAVTQGGAAILNSSFYQRYLGERESLKLVLIEQMISLPFPQATH
ncbi:TetR/AcrR family transcriptional regulator [Aquirhabdus sp.]|uniref:TetR/AcrR family transcriptional regulator n=1 Tax=Aquirhabdus sp. TaxID=2824160 RepID=UPI00396CE6F3